VRYALVEVDRFPKNIEEGELYWSREFEMCAHRCACGCGDVVKLPVDAANYEILLAQGGPTLQPSVGNWGVCNAHYLITAGRVRWAAQWTPEQIKRGRTREDARRQAFYAPVRRSAFGRLVDWVRRLIGR